MKKILIIVDPQYDFIEGGKLAVNGAQDKMTALAEYISEHGSDYEQIILTADWHPANHCSFTKNGGTWPVHCLQHSEGAAIFEPILNACYGTNSNVLVLTKGDNADIEEYSVVENEKNGKLLLELLSETNYDSIDICGLCGDFCVGQTIYDLCEFKYNDKIKVLTPYIESIDEGKKLQELIEKEKLQSI